MPLVVRIYLGCNVASVMPLYLTGFVWKQGYQPTYYLCTGLILASVLLFGWNQLRSVSRPWAAAAIACLIVFAYSGRAFYGLARQMSTDDWFMLAEASVLAWGAVIAGATAKRRDVGMVLMFFWLAQAAFDFAWLIEWPRYQTASWLVDPLLAIAGFIGIGLCYRPMRVTA